MLGVDSCSGNGAVGQHDHTLLQDEIISRTEQVEF